MDRILFIAISLIVIATILVVGDPMYVGLWYYIAIPAVTYLITLPFQPKPYFLTGVALATQVTYVPYFYHNLFSVRPDGLIGLGHLFSLPGLIAGVLVSGFIFNKIAACSFYRMAGAFIITLLCFLLNQLIVCNTKMYCGGLIWPLSLMSKS